MSSDTSRSLKFYNDVKIKSLRMAVNQVRNWFPLIWFSLFCLAILHLGIRRLGARFKCSYLLRYRTQSGSLPTILTRRTFISALIALLHYLNSTTWILLSCQTQLYTTNVLKCLESILKFIEPFSFYFFVLFSIRQRGYWNCRATVALESYSASVEPA